MSLTALGFEAAPPITAIEFCDAIARLWAAWSSSREHGWPRKLGLAVSGGGDSMALAFLCKQLGSKCIIPNLSAKAFVVDHKAREESTEEAHKVAEWLKDLGLQSEILTLQWPPGTIPSQLPGFESRSRTLRYQALGKACRSNGIQALLLGHHQDDNIETVLMRLARGHRGIGLKGVADIARIPECHGLYGICESGDVMDFKDIKLKATEGFAREKSTSGSRWFLNEPSAASEFLQVSEGGIYLFRPLQSFPKARLLSTCLGSGVPFVSDATNLDHTLTPRNAVRYLLYSGLLPRALRAPSILSLIEKTKASTNRLMELSNSLLEAVQILNLDLRAGTLIVRFPSPEMSESSNPATDHNSERRRRTQAVVVRRLLDLVSPNSENSVPLEQFRSILPRIFGESGRDTESGLVSATHDIFTLGGVLFQPIKGRSKPSGSHGLLPGGFILRKQTDLLTGQDPSDSNIWLLTRRPFSSRYSKPSIVFDLQIPASLTQTHSNITPWSNWHLWDNRYWIRIRAKNLANSKCLSKISAGLCADFTIPIILRPLEPEDLKFIRDELSHHETSSARGRSEGGMTSPSSHLPTLQPSQTIISAQTFDNLLSDYAPGKIRFTLPILAEVTSDNKQSILAFPSLGMETSPRIGSSVSSSVGDCGTWTLEWQIRYKRIDPEVLRLAWRK